LTKAWLSFNEREGSAVVLRFTPRVRERVFLHKRRCTAQHVGSESELIASARPFTCPGSDPCQKQAPERLLHLSFSLPPFRRRTHSRPSFSRPKSFVCTPTLGAPTLATQPTRPVMRHHENYSRHTPHFIPAAYGSPDDRQNEFWASQNPCLITGM